MERRSLFAAAKHAAHPQRAATRASTASGIVYTGGSPTVRIVGRVDREASSEVSGWIRGLIAAGAHHLVVDVSGALACDRHLLTVLSRANARLTASGDTFALVGLQLPEFIDALPRASLDELFIVYAVVRGESGRAMRSRTSARPVSAEGGGRHRRHEV